MDTFWVRAIGLGMIAGAAGGLLFGSSHDGRDAIAAYWPQLLGLAIFGLVVYIVGVKVRQ